MENSFQEDISSRVANIVKYMNMRREAGSKVDSTELLTVNLKVSKQVFNLSYEIDRFHLDRETIYVLNAIDFPWKYYLCMVKEMLYSL